MSKRLKLSDVWPGMQNGDLVLCRGRSPLSRFIAWWTQSKFAHVGVVVFDKVGDLGLMPHVIEARLGRIVSCRPLARVIEEDGPVDWYALTCPEIDRLAVATAARQFLGWPYASWFQFLRSFSVVTSRLLDRLGYPDDTDPERVFCSELVMEALRVGGLEWSCDVDPARMTPGDVALLTCVQRKGTVEL